MTARTSGRFAASRARAIKLLDRLDLVTDVIASPDYSAIIGSKIRNSSYTDLWQGFLRDGLYDVRLVDESFLQFVEAPLESFSFFDSPVEAISFESFGTEQIGASWDPRLDLDLAELMREEYEEYLGTLEFKRPATPVRYDYSPNQYRCACHPAAHLHFGFSSEVRLATRRRWSPESFAMFVVRQYFPKCWDRFVRASITTRVSAALRHNLEEIGNEFWGEQHEAEVYVV